MKLSRIQGIEKYFKTLSLREQIVVLALLQNLHHIKIDNSSEDELAKIGRHKERQER